MWSAQLLRTAQHLVGNQAAPAAPLSRATKPAAKKPPASPTGPKATVPSAAGPDPKKDLATQSTAERADKDVKKAGPRSPGS